MRLEGLFLLTNLVCLQGLVLWKTGYVYYTDKLTTCIKLNLTNVLSVCKRTGVFIVEVNKDSFWCISSNFITLKKLKYTKKSIYTVALILSSLFFLPNLQAQEPMLGEV